MEDIHEDDIVDYVVDDVAFEKWFDGIRKRYLDDPEKLRIIHRFAYAGWCAGAKKEALKHRKDYSMSHLLNKQFVI